ncbi:proline/glycine betaine ABC transporter permease [Tessaracoccus terricola]
MEFKLPFGDWVEAAVDWIVANAAAPFGAIREALVFLYEIINGALTVPPWWAVIIAITLLAFVARGIVFGVGAAVGLLLIVGLDQWVNAMDTLALVLVAAIIAVILAVPIGILAATFKPVSMIVKPVMDFLQTMPAFVYLIPALLLFRIGVAPGIVATIIFSLPPGVRLTELGIRGVDKEVVEAGSAFGASRFRILRQIQLPLAMPSIMAGINQVIMLSLSMVVIAGLVGAGGLGEQVIAALQRLDTALGFEAGLSVVILAILLDRFTGAFGLKKGFYSWAGTKLGQRNATKTDTVQAAEAA